MSRREIAALLKCAGKALSSVKRHSLRRRLGVGQNLANFDTFDDETICRIIWINGAPAMPRNWHNNSIPDPDKDQKPVDDFFASKLADRIRIDDWRKQLTLVRGVMLDIAEQGAQQGLVDLKRETVKVVRAIERLEAFLGLKAPH